MTSTILNFLLSVPILLGGAASPALYADAASALLAGSIIVGVVMLLSAAVLSVYIYDKYNPGLLAAKKLKIKTFFGGIVGGKLAIDYNRFGKEMSTAGYAYDERQDIFYSTHDAWQRDYGYCRLYDELAGPIGGMVFDSEPIYFEYAGKRWLIEFWKGQYGMNFGGEIGIYNTTEPDVDVPGLFSGTAFEKISDEEMLHMAFILRKDGKMVMAREDTHWWLTGFKLGGFAEPSELSMEIWVQFPNPVMLGEFLKGMYSAGYNESEIQVLQDNVIKFEYDKPKTAQPISRNPAAEWVIQRKNEQLCKMYRDVTLNYNTLPEKLDAVAAKAPALYKNMTLMGKTKSIYKDEKKIHSNRSGK
ncbi:MAG: DUF4474 domain-containing protein [Eubacteriales bacterium]